MSGKQTPGGVPDLGALREQGAVPERAEEGLAFYANDVQPSIETEGNVTLVFSYLGPEGMSRPVRVSMPTGLLIVLTNMVPEIVDEAAGRYAKQSTNLGKWLAGVGQTASAIAEARSTASPTDIDTRRG